ncbi:MAG: tetratricopeptide repeat protein [Arenicella sp.]|nr:tetratricopeptide repeat protein [Arenicella sp.]
MDNKLSDYLLELSTTQFADANYTAARLSLETILQSDPNRADVWSNLGYIAYKQGDYLLAKKQCAKALQLNPNFIGAYSNISLAYSALNEYLKAQTELEKGIAINPNETDLWTNLGLVHFTCNRIQDAIAAFKQALLIDPLSVPAHCNLALCLQEIGQAEKAYESYLTALDINPNYRPANSNIQMCSQYHPSLTSAQLLSIAKLASSSIENDATNDVKKSPPRTNCELRIGFTSADFRAHPVAWFLRDILLNFSQQNVEIICYANQVESDEITQELKGYVTAWRNINAISNNARAHMILKDQLDILIDLSGHTSGNVLDIFSRRLCPIQLSWLGYPATTAINNIDGILLSEDLVSEASGSFFTEKIVRFNGPQFVYRPPSYCPKVAKLPCSENGAITFGCFNNAAKLNDLVITTWASILRKIPDSRLVLKWKTLSDLSVQEVFLKRFHSLGVHQSRIELRGASSHEQMLLEYNDIDICLDPFPFSGALTSFEAIWMGVPVVTLYGDRPMSRQTYSINKALALETLNNTTPASYITTAIELSSNKTKLGELRLSMRNRIKKSALYDPKNMASTLLKVLKDQAVHKPLNA